MNANAAVTTLVLSNGEVLRAVEFALLAHAKPTTKNPEGQKRKYTNEPYIVHPLRVAKRVNAVLATYAISTEELLHAVMAAVLHDTVEDTEVTFEALTLNFGANVTKLVREVTEVSTQEDGNRAARKEKDNQHYRAASFIGKTIKLADSIDNLRDVVKHDPDFARVYLPEMRERLGILRGGHQELHGELSRLVQAYFYLHGELA